MSPHDQAEDLAPTLTVFAVLAVGLLALFAGYSWFWLVFVIGFAVVVPLVAILTSDEVRDEVQGRPRDGRDQVDELRDRDHDHGEPSWHGNRRGPWWQDVADDDWWDDLTTGSLWPDPERERERDREVRQRFGVPVDAGTDADSRTGAESDDRSTATNATAREDDDPAEDVQAALADLRARYARGELTDQQFDDELDRLLGRRDAGAEEREIA